MHYRNDLRAEAWALIEEHHYTGCRPRSSVLDVTAHLDPFGPPVAALTIGHPAARWSALVWELTRLCRLPDFGGPLTSLIAEACRLMRQRDDAEILVAYADSDEGHHGGIYQAASWHYHGRRGGRISHLMIDGIKLHPRTCNRRFGTSSIAKLREQFGIVEPIRTVGKRLFWKPINRRGKAQARRLGLQQTPYEKETL